MIRKYIPEIAMIIIFLAFVYYQFFVAVPPRLITVWKNPNLTMLKDKAALDLEMNPMDFEAYYVDECNLCSGFTSTNSKNIYIKYNMTDDEETVIRHELAHHLEPQWMSLSIMILFIFQTIVVLFSKLPNSHKNIKILFFIFTPMAYFMLKYSSIPEGVATYYAGQSAFYSYLFMTTVLISVSIVYFLAILKMDAKVRTVEKEKLKIMKENSGEDVGDSFK